MTLRELQMLVAQGEGLHIEFKRKLPEWEKLVREIVAFANTQGGSVLIGVDDDGSIFGTRDPIEVEEALKLYLQEYTHPVPAHSIETIPLSHKRAVVAIHVPKSTHKPIRALERPGHSPENLGHALIRIADSSAKASKEMVELLKYEGREYDVKVELREKETMLLQYLDAHPHITVGQFAALAKINRPVASRTLVHLVKGNMLRIVPQLQGDDWFCLLE
jgi:predicted HTH transcriptional regulator